MVGKRAYGPEFRRLAAKLRLIRAVEKGLNLAVFEQATPDVLGLKLTERSLRDVFIAEPGHPLLAGLRPADLVNLRGRSDLVEAYPEVTPGTEKVWPARLQVGKPRRYGHFCVPETALCALRRSWNAALTWSIRPCSKANGAPAESCCARSTSRRADRHGPRVDAAGQPDPVVARTPRQCGAAALRMRGRFG